MKKIVSMVAVIVIFVVAGIFVSKNIEAKEMQHHVEEISKCGTVKIDVYYQNQNLKDNNTLCGIVADNINDDFWIRELKTSDKKKGYVTITFEAKNDCKYDFANDPKMIENQRKDYFEIIDNKSSEDEICDYLISYFGEVFDNCKVNN